MLETDETPEDRPRAADAVPPHGHGIATWARGLAALIPHERASLPADPAVSERIFARRLKRERLRRGWRQEDLAAELADVGLDLHPSAIAKIEREPDPDKKIEPRMIRLNEAVTIAKVFELSLEEMLSDRDVSDPVRELELLRHRLKRAHAEAETAHAAFNMAQHTAMDLEVQAREAELRASLFMKLNVRDGEDVRAVAERFLDHWLRRTRDDLVVSGWGNSPDEVIGRITSVAQLWPDLANTCAKVIAKVDADAKWWIDEGRRLHEEWLHEKTQFSAGDQVEHPVLGRGRISNIYGSGDDIALTVDFEPGSFGSTWSRAAMGAEGSRKLRKVTPSDAE